MALFWFGLFIVAVFSCGAAWIQNDQIEALRKKLLDIEQKGFTAYIESLDAPTKIVRKARVR